MMDCGSPWPEKSTALTGAGIQCSCLTVSSALCEALRSAGTDCEIYRVFPMYQPVSGILLYKIDTVGYGRDPGRVTTQITQEQQAFVPLII